LGPQQTGGHDHCEDQGPNHFTNHRNHIDKCKCNKNMIFNKS
jgi:hypothetical protein